VRADCLPQWAARTSPIPRCYVSTGRSQVPQTRGPQTVPWGSPVLVNSPITFQIHILRAKNKTAVFCTLKMAATCSSETASHTASWRRRQRYRARNSHASCRDVCLAPTCCRRCYDTHTRPERTQNQLHDQLVRACPPELQPWHCCRCSPPSHAKFHRNPFTSSLQSAARSTVPVHGAVKAHKAGVRDWMETDSLRRGEERRGEGGHIRISTEPRQSQTLHSSRHPNFTFLH
jgi:hypothetical protein